MDEMEKELKLGFLEEARQLLVEAKTQVAALEKAVSGTPEMVDLYTKLYRIAHNLKGAAGAVGFAPLGEFSLHLESFLKLLKIKDLKSRAEYISLTGVCFNYLDSVVSQLSQNLEASFDYTVLIQKLDQAKKGGGDGVAVAVPGGSLCPNSSPLPSGKAQINQTEAEMYGELKTTFLDEVIFLLVEVQKDIQLLSEAVQARSSYDPEVMSRLYRMAHNIKSAAGAVGFGQLGEFARYVEAFLVRLRKQEVPLDAEALDLLVECEKYFSTSAQLLKGNNEAFLPENKKLFQKIAVD